MTDSPILDSTANGNYYQKDACRVKRINPLKVSCDEVELNKPGLLRKNLIILLFIIFQICGCGGGGSDDPANDPDSGPTKNVNVSGPWDGTATAQNGSVYQTAFTLTQDGNNIGGTCEWVTEDETYHSPDVSGTVNNSTVTISIIFRDTENPDNYLELVYSGTVDGSDISGDITITGIWDGTERNGKASFTLSRPDDDPDPNPEPEDNTIKVSDDIEEPTTWENQYVYVISEDLYVENTLTIQAGTVIKLQFGTDVKVQREGIIIAQGTPDEPVVFTSYADDEQRGDTNKDANASTPTMADWEGIIIY